MSEGDLMITTAKQKGIKKHLTPLFKQYIRHYDLVLMFLPCFIYFIIFHYVPMYGITIAFKQFRMLDGIMASPWVGFEHFQRLFSGTNFLRVFSNTLSISLLRIVFGFPVPIILALLLNEVNRMFYKRAVQTLSYLPHFFSWIVLGGMVLMLFSINGPINQIFIFMGFKPIQFLTNNYWYIITLIGTGIWQSAGYGSIIYLAALSGIDIQLYEAAMVDGANRWKQTIHITLPSLIPTAITLFILNLGYILNAGFDQIYNTYNPMVYDVADIIDTYVLRRLQSMDYSLGTAAGLFKSLVGTTLIILTNWLSKRYSDGEYGIW